MNLNRRMTKKILLSLITLFIAIIYLVQSYFLPVQKIEVDLSRCVDGDTAHFIVHNEDVTVRFLSIDAPESTNIIETFGKASAEYTCSRLENASVIELEFDRLADKDKYDRQLAWVWVDDTLLQADLIQKGYAEVAYLYENYKYNNDLLELEKQAQSNRVGLWK